MEEIKQELGKKFQNNFQNRMTVLTERNEKEVRRNETYKRKLFTIKGREFSSWNLSFIGLLSFFFFYFFPLGLSFDFKNHFEALFLTLALSLP